MFFVSKEKMLNCQKFEKHILVFLQIFYLGKIDEILGEICGNLWDLKKVKKHKRKENFDF